jgi:hypothetical protein
MYRKGEARGIRKRRMVGSGKRRMREGDVSPMVVFVILWTGSVEEGGKREEDNQKEN